MLPMPRPTNLAVSQCIRLEPSRSGRPGRVVQALFSFAALACPPRDASPPARAGAPKRCSGSGGDDADGVKGRLRFLQRARCGEMSLLNGPQTVVVLC